MNTKDRRHYRCRPCRQFGRVPAEAGRISDNRGRGPDGENRRATAAAFIGAGQATTDVVRAAAHADIVFITTPDGVIQTVCDTIAAAGSSGRVRSSSICRARIRWVCSMQQAPEHVRAVLHPLQSLASREQGIRTLPGSYFRVEADPEALETARRIVKALGGIELGCRSGVRQGVGRAVPCGRRGGFELFRRTGRLRAQVLRGAGSGQKRSAQGSASPDPGNASEYRECSAFRTR